ncbi:hypothetical protein [Domibacillus robiginosus]|uniref:hypothetical protein n=1 Tax=Domibacillus robiginosus TaxID=1071054 RepID=UPI00067DD18B|nr:hypothetical protein [Domibacillus robiginosus]
MKHSIGYTRERISWCWSLFVIACQKNFDLVGFEGYVIFIAKIKLVEHYQKTLNAVMKIKAIEVKEGVCVEPVKLPGGQDLIIKSQLNKWRRATIDSWEMVKRD